MKHASAFLIVVMLALCGCHNAAEEPTRREVNPLRAPTGAMAQNDVTRGAQKQIHQNSMDQIKLFYTMFCDDRHHPTATQKKFLKNIARDAHPEHHHLKENHVVLVNNVQPTSQTIIAYEKEPYQKWMNR